MDQVAYDVEPINVGFSNPTFEFIGYMRRSAYDRRTKSTYRDMLGHGELGPFRDTRSGF